mmetsp:Transcript_6700/g.10063  ORF Transcript_6700/g.10063 Transcript_6700/m.10063 type:complete len:98 (-) Transcript_6700:775-1068(-)
MHPLSSFLIHIIMPPLVYSMISPAHHFFLDILKPFKLNRDFFLREIVEGVGLDSRGGRTTGGGALADEGARAVTSGAACLDGADVRGEARGAGAGVD